MVLWIWFLGCTTTYRIGKFLLVDGMGIKSAEFFALCLYSIGLASYHFFQPVGKWILLAILVLWFTVQFLCHWYYTIFGASEKKIKGYKREIEKMSYHSLYLLEYLKKNPRFTTKILSLIINFTFINYN